MQWSKLVITLFGLAFAAKDDSGDSSSSAVLQLTNANFDSFIKEHPNVLVKFYAPWCGHCKKLAPEYEAAAEILKSDGIPLAKVDSTEEKELSERFEIRGFPTMYFFRNGKHEEYDGGRTKDSIVQWVKSMTGPAVKEFDTKAEAVKAAKDKKDGVTYLLITPSKDHESMRVWQKVADASRSKGAFLAVIDPKAKKSVVEVYGHGGVVYVAPTELLTEEALSDFIVAESTPLFAAINQDTYRAYATKTDNWFWFAGTKEDYDKVAEDMSKVARAHRKDINFVWLDASNDQFKRHAESMFGMTSFPNSVLVMRHDKYKYEGPYTLKDAGKFVKDVLDGKIEKFLLSEDIPEHNDEPVKVVVGKNFKDIVLQKDKDVFLEVYAPWCGHCKKFAPTWEELAIKLKNSKNLVIAKMDGIANEPPVEGFDVRSFPILFFVKANSTEPIIYSGSRNLDDLIKFIKENAVHPVVVTDSGADGEDDGKDEL